MQGTMQTSAVEQALKPKQQAWQSTSFEPCRERPGSSEMGAHALPQTFCGSCGFWFETQHQCPLTHMANVSSSQRRLTAFCQTCPDPDKVTRMLKVLGFHLVFSMPADDVGGYMADLPPLPAQYHYEDAAGTRVEYLAGVDTLCLDDDEESESTSQLWRFPPHASRFWLTSGGQELAARRAKECLTQLWMLHWQENQQESSLEEVA